MKIYYFLKYIIIICCIVILYNCTENINNSTLSYTHIKIIPIKLKFLGHWLGEGKKEDFVKEFANEFEFKNQDIQILMEYPENIYYKREIYHSEDKFIIKQITAEKSDWDVIRLNNIYQGIVDETGDPGWAKKYLVDFSEFPEFRKNVLPEVLSEDIKANWGGIIPGPINESNLWALWYNADLANKIGIKIKQFGMTFDDFIGYIKALNDYNTKNSTDIIPIYETDSWPMSILIAEQLFYSEVGNYEEIKNKEFSDHKFQALQKVLRSLQKLSIYNPISKNRSKSIWLDGVNLPLEEKCLFYCNGMWMYNIWLKNSKVKTMNMIPAELPVFENAVASIGEFRVTWAVPKNAPHKEQAIKFLLAMNNSDVAYKWSRYTKTQSGISSEINLSDFGLDQFDKFYYTLNNKYRINKLPMTETSEYFLGEKNRSISVKAVEIMEGSITADFVINDINKKLRK